MKEYAHQTKSRTFLKTRQRAIDASDPGTGKTYVEIKDFADRRAKRGGKAMVFAPKSLLRSAWLNDFKKFAPHLTCSVVEAHNRAKALAVDADVYIVNTDGVKAIRKLPAAFFKPFDTLIIDESTAFKHQTSARSRDMNHIKRYFKWRRVMSGTFITNGVTDAWHQVFIVDDGERLGSSFFAFRSAICDLVVSGPRGERKTWVPKESAKEIVSSLIADITIRHVFEDCVDIPPNHTYERTFELSPKLRKAYDTLLQQSIIEHKKKRIVALNGAVLRGKLLQIASGAVYSDDGSYALFDSERYELVADLVEERDHSLVFFNWTHQRDELIKLAKARSIKYALIDGTVTRGREEIVKHFQAGFYQVLFAHPQSAGHGLTLTKATRTIWASPTDNLEFWIQANRRIYRIGQTQSTETIVTLAADTFDERAWASCQAKDATLKGFYAYLEGRM